MNADSATIAGHSDAAPATPEPAREVTSAQLVVRNVLWNLGGTILPSIAALVSIPFLTRDLGTDQFGILTLSWVVIGQLNVFDLGLGRALTKLVAERLGTQRETSIPPLFWASFLLTLILGVAAGMIVACLAPWLVHRVLKIPVVLQPETLRTFYLIALALPAVVSTIGLRGFLEGCHRFDLLNAVRIPATVFFYLGPLLVLPFSRRLLPAMIVLVAGRLVGWLAHLWVCVRAFPALYHRSPRGAPLHEMFSFGTWMTVSNLISPIMVSLDRFMIAAVLSVTAVTYYATPNEVITRFLVLPAAIVAVLFPVFSASLAQAPQRTAALFDRSLKCIFVLAFPVILLLVGFGHEALSLWLGPVFADNSTRVLQWLSIGVFFNSVGFIPFAQLQGAGRPDLTAKLHLLELPLYLAALWGLVHLYGIVGASLAWLFRAGLDSCLLLFATGRILPACRAAARYTSRLMFAGGCLLAVPTFLPALWPRVAYVAITAAIFCVLGWSRLLTSRERGFVYEWLRV
ncbi:MAG: flippase [Terriglobales bacterium]